MTNIEIGAIFEAIQRAAERGDTFAVTVLYSRLRQHYDEQECVSLYLDNKLIVKEGDDEQ